MPVKEVLAQLIKVIHFVISDKLLKFNCFNILLVHIGTKSIPIISPKILTCPGSDVHSYLLLFLREIFSCFLFGSLNLRIFQTRLIHRYHLRVFCDVNLIYLF